MNIQLAKFFNIPLYLNIYTIPFALFLCLNNNNGLGELSLAIFVIGLFFVVLHEYGHCLMARRFGWKIYDITILPIGGVAQIAFKHDKPTQEIYVSLAGPAVSAILTLPFFVLGVVAIYLEQFPLMLLSIVCFLSNLMIVAFNILPIFPMDGGRVLRALLACKLGHERATWWAVRIGQAGGLLMAAIACYFGYWIAAFIFVLMSFLSQNELAYARLIAAVDRVRVKVAWILNKPELKKADLPELLKAVELVQDEKLREELVVFLKELSESRISI